MRRLGAVLAVLLLSACSFSAGGKDTSSLPAVTPSPTPKVPCHATLEGPAPGERGIVLRGCVADPDGRPARATVVVAHDAGFLESLGVALNIVTTLGTACLVDNACLGPEHPSVAARTDADGQFRIVIPPNADAAQAGHDRVFVSLPSGVQVETTFKVREPGTGDVVLRPVYDWAPHFAFSLTPTAATARFSPIAGIGQGYRLSLDENLAAPFSLPVQPGDPLDPHLVPPGHSRVGLAIEIGSATYKVPGREITAPDRSLSRGARCTVTDPQGRTKRTSELDACRIGDGDWRTEVIDPFFVCGERFATLECLDKGWTVTVDLGRIQRIRDVVVARGFDATVEVSADGRRWQPWGVLGPRGGDAVSHPVSAPVAVRYLRLGGDGLGQITEVAVFG